MEKFAIALSRFKRNRLDECISLCDEILNENPKDQSVQLLKMHAIRKKHSLDDLEVDEEGIGDMMLDDNRLSTACRPGTSIQRPGTSQKGGSSPLVRPVSSSGRPVTGVIRPATGSGRIGTQSNQSRLQTASKGARLGTTRATTAGGRYMRIATASLQSLNSSLVLDINAIQSKTIVAKQSIAKAVVDYLFFVEKNFKKMLEVCSEGTVYVGFKDWWWKYKLGKVYYKLGFLSEAEKQLTSSLKDNFYVNTVLQLSQLYLKQDQPKKSLEVLCKAAADNPAETYYLIYQARIQEMLNENGQSLTLYKSVLSLDNCNFEAIACIGSEHFYNDQPELALRYYKRLYELGINTAEIWNNIGLCSFYAGQYDFCLSCFERALILADDEMSGEIWYNISHVAIGLGEIELAYQALKITVSYNNVHYEAFNNLGILEIKKNNNLDQAKSNFLFSCKNSDFSFEPYYNYASMRYKQGDYEDSLKHVRKALEIFPEHCESKELEQRITKALYI